MRDMLKHSLLCLLFTITFVIPSITQSEKLTYTRAYDLNFKIVPDSMRLSPWIENAAYPAIPYAPMGSYLKKEYDNNYCQLFVTTEGSKTAGHSMLKYAPIDMNKAPTNSLEHYLNTLTDCSIYFPLTSAFDRLMLTRYIGFKSRGGIKKETAEQLLFRYLRITTVSRR